MMEERFKKRIRRAIYDRPYSGYFGLIFILFFAFNIFVNQSLALYLSPGSLRLWFAIAFFGMNFLISGLVALNINLIIIRYKEVGGVSVKGGGVSSLGVIGGILGGSCPACFAGVFPALMGALGVAVDFRAFPLHGLEMQIVAVALLVVSIRMFIRDPVCKVKFG